MLIKKLIILLLIYSSSYVSLVGQRQSITKPNLDGHWHIEFNQTKNYKWNSPNTTYYIMNIKGNTVEYNDPYTSSEFPTLRKGTIDFDKMEIRTERDMVKTIKFSYRNDSIFIHRKSLVDIGIKVKRSKEDSRIDFFSEFPLKIQLPETKQDTNLLSFKQIGYHRLFWFFDEKNIYSPNNIIVNYGDSQIEYKFRDFINNESIIRYRYCRETDYNKKLAIYIDKSVYIANFIEFMLKLTDYKSNIETIYLAVEVKNTNSELEILYKSFSLKKFIAEYRNICPNLGEKYGPKKIPYYLAFSERMQYFVNCNLQLKMPKNHNKQMIIEVPDEVILDDY